MWMDGGWALAGWEWQFRGNCTKAISNLKWLELQIGPRLNSALMAQRAPLRVCFMSSQPIDGPGRVAKRPGG